jgi:hypothetical protein
MGTRMDILALRGRFLSRVGLIVATHCAATSSRPGVCTSHEFLALEVEALKKVNSISPSSEPNLP